MYPKIDITDGVLTVPGYTGRVNLADYQSHTARTIRVYDDGNKNLVVDPPVAHWLLAEIDIPRTTYVSVGAGEKAVSTKEAFRTDKVNQRLWKKKLIVPIKENK